MDYYIGIDVGATYTKYGIIGSDGKIEADSRIETRPDEHVTKFLPRIFEAVEKLIDEFGDEDTIKGIGIGAPNGNYYKGTVENPANLKWGEETPLADLFNQKFGLPVKLTNDANAAAIGEMKFGAAKDFKHFFMITLGTGLGSGIVVDGKIVHGHTGFAGEMGHTIVKEEGRESPFGRKGGLEAYVSVTGLKRSIAKLLADSLEYSILRDVPYNELTGEKITDAAMKGDRIALDAYDYTGSFLGKALANAVLLTSPEAIILFGGLAHAKDLIFQPTLRHLEANLLPAFKGTVKLLFSELQEKHAGVLGAAALIMSELED